MRGKHATKPMEQVLVEANQLANDGVRELNIVAGHNLLRNGSLRRRLACPTHYRIGFACWDRLDTATVLLSDVHY